MRTLPAGELDRGELVRLQCRAAAEILAEGHFAGREAITALAWDDLQFRSVRVPSMPEEDLAEVIRFEATERLNLDPENSAIRFMTAGEVRQGSETRQEAIAFGVPSSVVEARMAMLDELRLDPTAIDAPPCAVFRVFEQFLQRAEDVNEVNVFLDVGCGGTRVLVTRGKDIVFFKSIAVGGRRFDQLTATGLGLTVHEAAELRIRLHRQGAVETAGQESDTLGDELVGESMRQAVLQAVRPAYEQLAKEIALCLRYCSVTFRGMRPEAVTVVGGEACMQDMLRVLADQLNLQFRTGRPLKHTGMEKLLAGTERRNGQPEWATALGLALKPVIQPAEVN